MRRTIIVLVILGLIGFFGFRTLFGGQTVSWHQRLTLIVQTPSGEVRGSAVTAVTNTLRRGLLVPPEAGNIVPSYRGEAVVVEVLPGRYLFALFKGVLPDGDAPFWVYSAYDLEGPTDLSEKTYAKKMARVKRQPFDSPVPLPPVAYPLMVTFDDITKPETVRRVDPDDLDAAFGCVRETALSRYPWRVAAITYREWVAGEVARLSREMASERSGLTGPVGDAIAQTYFITDDHTYNAADEQRIAELQTQFSEQQRRTWLDARYALEQELPATLPTPQTLSALTGGPCHQLTSVTLEITQDAVTEGHVEEVLGWLQELWPNMLDGKRYETIDASNRLANSLTSNSFSTEITK